MRIITKPQSQKFGEVALTRIKSLALQFYNIYFFKSLTGHNKVPLVKVS